eukprot:CAMPEP_0116990856 /NCGR_PEP_ID=MMETSP0467-20121206/65749_1 /TAXON_ID=283647 /ORGANISM="Mesodinium pulex, Strain SPMC105" /LENGTH=97 /DNA_ID=CAMNT_0004687743 /DNA_START=1034 /DNA_END=1327 /DNA_ORIENTATION=-
MKRASPLTLNNLLTITCFKNFKYTYLTSKVKNSVDLLNKDKIKSSMELMKLKTEEVIKLSSKLMEQNKTINELESDKIKLRNKNNELNIMYNNMKEE